MSTFKLLLLAVMILCGVVLVSLPIAEGTFRLLGVAPANETIAVYRSFKDSSYRLKQNISSREDWASGSFWIHTDDMGLRVDADRKYSVKPGDQINTLILGDSQALGQGVDFPDSIVGVMTMIAAEDQAVVANAAVGGHYLRNQRELAQSLRDEENLRFDRVAVLLTSRGLEIPDGYSSAVVDENGRLSSSKTPSRKARIQHWLKTNLAAYKVIRDAYHNQVGETVRNEDASVAIYSKLHESSFIDRWRQEMALTQKWADQLGVALVIVLLPESFDLEVDHMAAGRDGTWAHVDSYVPVRIMQTVCDELGIPFINTRPVLDTRQTAGKDLHLGTDFHYNAETSHEVGRFIWQELRNQAH